MTGHKGNLEEYNRYSLEKKLEMYLKLEPELFVFEVKPDSDEVKTIKESFEELKKENKMQIEIMSNGYRIMDSLIRSQDDINEEGPDGRDMDNFIKTLKTYSKRA